jgi:adenosyl cobinamide kinase/adenosyl cobinamide phosphate guanylyltransferase
MHFVFGGAFNGKRKWVKHTYKEHEMKWISAYDDPALPQLAETDGLLVLEGLEVWVKGFITSGSGVKETAAFFEQMVPQWAEGCTGLVLIGTEIGKGIVPVNEEDRMWRDACGYVYQRIAQQAETVDQIWYGISTRLKGEQEK